MQDTLSSEDVKQNSIKILYKKYGQRDSIYACAEEWSQKQVVTTGIVQYYEAYWMNK
mgnify:CR=1 FL=1|tara:strand:+ start:265 stop:435 length:171 start_codon:yes stop_codon:yes gene_type:complete